jgi:hypothetical protein
VEKVTKLDFTFETREKMIRRDAKAEGRSARLLLMQAYLLTDINQTARTLAEAIHITTENA